MKSKVAVAIMLSAALALSACAGEDDADDAGTPDAAAASETSAPESSEEPGSTDEAEATEATEEPESTEDSTADEPAAPEGEIEVEFSQELADMVPQAIQDRGHMVWTAAVKVPFLISDESGNFTGLDPDLQAAVEELTGVDIEFQSAEGLQALLLNVQSGRADFFPGGLRATEEREQDFDYVIWLSTQPSYLFSSDREDEIQDTSDLCGLTVAIEEGGAMEMFVDQVSEQCTEAGEDPVEILGLVDEAALLAVDSGRADAVGANFANNAYVQLQQEGTYGLIPQDTGTPDLTGGVSAKGNGVGEFMDAVFKELMAQGAYEDLLAKWNMEGAAVPEILYNPFENGTAGQ